VRRGRLIGLAAAFFLTSGVGSAHACINVHIGAYPTAAHAGDVVQYSVSSLEVGASYTISVNGSIVADGTATGDIVRGPFTMPNLGAQQATVTLGVTFDHSEIDGARGVDTTKVTYEPVAASPPAPPPAAAAPPAPAPAPAAAQPRASQPVPRTTAPSEPTQPQPGPRISRPAAPRAIRTGPVATRMPAASTGGRPSVRPQLRVAAAPTALREPTRRAAPSRTPRAAPPRPHVLPQIGARRAAPVQPSARAAPADERQRPLWWFAAALLLAGGGIAGGVILKRRRPTPSPLKDDLALEAELQEMIAETRARELRSDLTRTD
jgi:hypothetical protein